MFKSIILIGSILMVSALPLLAQDTSDAATHKPGARAGDVVGEHRFIIDFQPTAIEDMVPVRESFIEGGIFQEILEEVADQVALPQDVPVTFKDCGEPSAFWMPGERTMTVCYELISLYNTGYEEVQGDERNYLLQASKETVLSGTTIFIMLHELGHGLIDLFNLPITGREEDAADQFAALTLIGSDEEDDAFEDRPSRLALLAAYLFQQLSHSPDQLTRQLFSNEHALGQQRYYDVMCMVLGSNTEVYGPILTLGIEMVDAAATRYPEMAEDQERVKEWLERTDDLNLLPYARAFRCPAEYAKYNASWDYLLDTFMVPAETN